MTGCIIVSFLLGWVIGFILGATMEVDDNG